MDGFLAALLVLVAAQPVLNAQSGGEPPDFKQVYDLVRAHVPGLSEEQLNRLAVQGLVSELAPRVSLVNSDAPLSTPSEGPLVSKSTLFDGDIAYVRIGRVDDGLPLALEDAYHQLSPTNKLKGVVVDLRYTGGEDYASAAAAADLFLKTEQPLLNWGNGVVRSKEKKDALTSPVAVLVNAETSGPAEALAGVLRQTGVGLILGSQTAGRALIAKEFPLKNGQLLRIATSPIQLGDGSSLSGSGLKPDISVAISSQDERAYYADSFRVISQTNLMIGAGMSLANSPQATNHTRRMRPNEAELVRERREGVNIDAEAPLAMETETDKPLVHDPALARAIDLLKGLAVVRASRL
jgi:hypothetical protein